jgi:hypothetical protein
MVCQCYKVNLHSVSASSTDWWRTRILWITVLSQLSFLLQVGIQFIGNSIYASVWVAAVCLFMELLGFSTQKWITAGGFGTVLLTLAGREIFTNFLSSVMIHATRPFVESEWIQTKIEGQEVSGTVEVSTSGRNQVDWVHSLQPYELKGDPQRHAKSLSFTTRSLLLPLFQLFVVAPTCQEFSCCLPWLRFS